MSAQLDPIPDLVRTAVERLIVGDSLGAAASIGAIDAAALSAARESRLREVRMAVSGAAPVQRVKSHRGGVSEGEKLAVFRADRFVCRICSRRTVYLPVLKAVSAALPDEFPFHSNWAFGEGHPLYWTHSTSLEHVVPLARGGADDVSNFVTTCYGCNDARGDYLLEEIGWKLSPRVNVGWAGLSEFLPKLPALVHAPRSSGRRSHPRHELVAVDDVQAGWLVRFALPGRVQPRQHRVDNVDASGWTVREMWVSGGRWTTGVERQVGPEGKVELVTKDAPEPGQAA